MKWPWQRASTPQPTEPHEPFLMVVEDVFEIANRGTVATGRIGAGSVTVGQQLRILRAGTVLSTTTVTGIEQFRKVLDTACAGDNVGLLLDGVTGANVMRDDVLEG